VDSNRDQSIFRMAIACLKVEWSWFENRTNFCPVFK
jgi:hypothetical protein